MAHTRRTEMGTEWDRRLVGIAVVSSSLSQAAQSGSCQQSAGAMTDDQYAVPL
jgi:hypothetical protein